MAAIKDWLIDMENYTYEAIENGFTSLDDVVAYVNTYIIADEKYIQQVLEAFHKEPDYEHA